MSKFPLPRRQFSQAQVVEIGSAIMQAISKEYDLSPEELDRTTDLVSDVLIKSLLACNVELPWLKIRRH